MRSTRSLLALGVAGAFATTVGIASLASAQQQQAPNGAPKPADLGKQLVDGLKNTPGCLGVDNCQWQQSGRFTICAWFENKAAVVRWYDSPTHAFTMRALGDDPAKHKPLEHITDPNTPIMVMATMTLGGQPIAPGAFPASQFSVEIYAPLPGGAAISGRLAPEGFKIPHFESYDNTGAQGQPAPKPTNQQAR